MRNCASCHIAAEHDELRPIERVDLNRLLALLARLACHERRAYDAETIVLDPELQMLLRLVTG
jgi:hypothetical protein